MALQEASRLAVALSGLIRLLGESEAPESLRDALLAVCASVASGDADLGVEGDALYVGETPIDVAVDDVQPLLSAMRRHALASIAIESTASARELLLLANVLAEPAPQGQASDAPAQRLDRRLLELGCWHVLPRLRATPEVAPSAAEATSGPRRPVVSAALACETLEAAQAFIEQLTRTLQVHRLEDDAVGTASVLLDVVLIERQVAALTGSSDHANTNDSTKNAAATANIGGGNAELSALWTATFEQFATSGALRLVATLLSSDALDHGSLLSVMQRAGDAGAGALIAELIAESDRTKRRALFDTIVVVRAGLPLLLRSLQHPMWYVVRNSAALLGAMRAPNVEPQLAMTLAHTDERVRLAATTALSRIGTTAAIGALGAAMRDRSAAVRHRAFRQLRKAQGTSINATVVGDALELERNADAQRELLDALLASTSPETVQRIVKLCSPSSRGVFSAELRITMFEALMRLRPAAAMPILRMAAEDRDPVVRARARELMATPVPTPTPTPTPVAVATA